MAAVVDSDTLRVEGLAGRDLGRLLLVGIDAPEVVHPSTPAECYADVATEQLEELAPVGGTVTADAPSPTATGYGRMLRYVDHAGVDVSRELLVTGAARLYDTDQQPAR